MTVTPLHIRGLIRAAVADLLVAADVVEDRVYATRVHPVQRDNLPCICVYTSLPDAPERSEMHNIDRALWREIPLILDIRCRATDEVDDVLDNLCAAVETAMDADPSFGRLAHNSWLAETTTGFDGEGEKANALARMTYTVTTRTAAGAPGARG